MKRSAVQRDLQVVRALIAIDCFADALLALLPLRGERTFCSAPARSRRRRTGLQTYSLTLQILILMTLLTLLPAILLAMTAFHLDPHRLFVFYASIGHGDTPKTMC